MGDTLIEAFLSLFGMGMTIFQGGVLSGGGILGSSRMVELGIRDGIMVFVSNKNLWSRFFLL